MFTDTVKIANKPRVSVIVPAYNHARYVEKTIGSIFESNYENIELIILDDGSSDNTADVIRAFIAKHANDLQQLIFIRKANEGIAKTLNQGIDLSTGEFIFLLASDDYLNDSSALGKLIELMTSDRDIGLVCSDACFVDGNNQKIQRYRAGKPHNSFVEFNFPDRLGLTISKDFGSYRSLLLGNYIPSGVLIRKSVYELLGKYNPEKIVEDYGFWLAMSKQFRLCLLPESLLCYRLHESNTISTRRDRIFLEVADLLLQEHNYAKNHGIINYWRQGACSMGLTLLRSGNTHLILKSLKLLLLSIPAWAGEFSLFVKRRYYRQTD